MDTIKQALGAAGGEENKAGVTDSAAVSLSSRRHGSLEEGLMLSLRANVLALASFLNPVISKSSPRSTAS